jgi:hypothetical protein
MSQTHDCPIAGDLKALALFRRLGDRRGIAIATGYLGHLAALRGDYGKAGKLLTESLASLRELGDDVTVALMYNFLGQVRLSGGTTTPRPVCSARVWTRPAASPTGSPC